MIKNKKNLISSMLVVTLTMLVLFGTDFSSKQETKVDAAVANPVKVNYFDRHFGRHTVCYCRNVLFCATK